MKQGALTSHCFRGYLGLGSPTPTSRSRFVPSVHDPDWRICSHTTKKEIEEKLRCRASVHFRSHSHHSSIHLTSRVPSNQRPHPRAQSSHLLFIFLPLPHTQGPPNPNLTYKVLQPTCHSNLTCNTLQLHQPPQPDLQCSLCTCQFAPMSLPILFCSCSVFYMQN